MAMRDPAAIYVVSPGGRHATGGICRMVDNLMTEWEQRERQPSLVLVDSYGNKGKGHMPAYFAAAFWCVLYNGLRGRIGLLHLHMAECGSVLRKGMLVWLARLLGVPAVVHVHGRRSTQLRLISELHRLQMENGALATAYQNALNDQQRSRPTSAALRIRSGRWLMQSNSVIVTTPVAAGLAVLARGSPSAL